MKAVQKRIGTFIPLSALTSTLVPKSDAGTFSTGLIFLDWLKKTQQSIWQFLPLHLTQLEYGSATKRIPSPYKGYGIGLDPKYLPSFYNTILPTEQEKSQFVATHNQWIHDYSLFCALSDYFNTDDWRNWEKSIKTRTTEGLALWRKRLYKQIDEHIITQWKLHHSYAQLRNKAKKLYIFLSGDVPFYISIQSPLVWAHKEVFDIKKNGDMHCVSGVPNKPKSFFGRQVWGHPLYNWQNTNSWPAIFAFWQLRLSYLAGLFDIIRFDYAKAFFYYGAMSLQNKREDEYRKGPGAKTFEELMLFCRKIGLSVFAEDSGNKIIEMRKSLKTLGIAGIKILRFALDEKKDLLIPEYADVAQYSPCTTVYTSTHDTETLLGYIHNLTSDQKQRLAKTIGTVYDADTKALAKKFRDAIIASPAQTVIIPMQDWLLTTERINVPGTEKSHNDPNWNFLLKIPVENLPTHF